LLTCSCSSRAASTCRISARASPMFSLRFARPCVKLPVHVGTPLGYFARILEELFLISFLFLFVLQLVPTLNIEGFYHPQFLSTVLVHSFHYRSFVPDTLLKSGCRWFRWNSNKKVIPAPLLVVLAVHNFSSLLSDVLRREAVDIPSHPSNLTSSHSFFLLLEHARTISPLLYLRRALHNQTCKSSCASLLNLPLHMSPTRISS